MLRLVFLGGHSTIYPLICLQLMALMQSCVHVCALASLWKHVAKLLSKVALAFMFPGAVKEAPALSHLSQHSTEPNNSALIGLLIACRSVSLWLPGTELHLPNGHWLSVPHVTWHFFGIWSFFWLFAILVFYRLFSYIHHGKSLASLYWENVMRLDLVFPHSEEWLWGNVS